MLDITEIRALIKGGHSIWFEWIGSSGSAKQFLDGLMGGVPYDLRAVTRPHGGCVCEVIPRVH